MAKTIWKSSVAAALVWCFLSYSSPLYSQHQLGVFGGVTRGLNEGSVGTQSANPTAGMGLLFDHSPTSSFSVEMQFFASRIGTETFTKPNDYQTSLLTFQFVSRYYFLKQYQRVKPFIGTGVGFTFFNNDSIPKNLPPQFRDFFGVTLSFPIFIGTTIPLSDAFDLDIQTGSIMTLSDQLHPIEDGTNDAWLFLRFGVYCSFSKLFSLE